MDRIDALRAFVIVGDLGSFAAAARRLGLSRALVSRQVAAAEAEFGQRLLSRTTRRVSFTGAGSQFHPKARAIVEAFDDAKAEARAEQLAPSGPIKVTAPMSFGLRHLADAVLDFACAYPDVTVHLDLNDRFVDMVEDGFDVGVRVGRLADSTLVARRLGTQRRVVCASPDYLRLNGSPEAPAELSRHRCLHYGYSGSVERWPFHSAGRDFAVPVRPVFRSNSGEVLLRAALRGLGIAFQPWFIVGSDVEAGRLRVLLAEYEEPALPFHILMPPGRASTSVRAFVDFLVNRFSDR